MCNHPRRGQLKRKIQCWATDCSNMGDVRYAVERKVENASEIELTTIVGHQADVQRISFANNYDFDWYHNLYCYHDPSFASSYSLHLSNHPCKA